VAQNGQQKNGKPTGPSEPDEDDEEDAVVTVRKKGLLAELVDFFLDMRNR